MLLYSGRTGASTQNGKRKGGKRAKGVANELKEQSRWTRGQTLIVSGGLGWWLMQLRMPYTVG